MVVLIIICRLYKYVGRNHFLVELEDLYFEVALLTL